MVTQFNPGQSYIMHVATYTHIFKVLRIKYDKKDNCNILYIKTIYSSSGNTINSFKVNESLFSLTRELTKEDKVEFL